MHKLNKIVICLPLLFLNIEQINRNTQGLGTINATNHLIKNWKWSLGINKAFADLEIIDVYGSPWESWDTSWYAWSYTSPCDWSCNHEDSGGDESQQLSPEYEPWSTAKAAGVTIKLYQLIDILKQQLAVVGLSAQARIMLQKDIGKLNSIAGFINSGVTINDHIINKEYGEISGELASLVAGIVAGGVIMTVSSQPVIVFFGSLIIAELAKFGTNALSDLIRDIYDDLYNSPPQFNRPEHMCRWSGVLNSFCQYEY